MVEFGLHVAQGRGKWRVAVNMGMNIQIPGNEGNFLTS